MCFQFGADHIVIDHVVNFKVLSFVFLITIKIIFAKVRDPGNMRISLKFCNSKQQFTTRSFVFNPNVIFFYWGGVYRILKIIADQMAETYAQNEISARISNYWNQLAVEEQITATDEYLQNFRHLLPTEFTEGSATKLRVHFIQVLNEHPKMIRRIRQIGR